MSKKEVNIHVGDGAAIPSKKDQGLFSAWWIAFLGSLAIIVYLCLSEPDPYLDILKFLPDGILVTFQVTIYSILLSLVIGLVTGLGRLSRNRFFNLVASTYVEIIRGIPLLVQLFYIYYALGKFDFFSNLPPIAAAVIAMAICYGAYMGEVFRAGIDSIDHGQTEAARTLGFNRTRTILPPVGNEFIALLKDSSLVSILAVADILRRGREFASESFYYFEAFTMVALVYLVITLILSKGVSHMEHKLNYYERH
jgi:polar amino acid transport system permease protein